MRYHVSSAICVYAQYDFLPSFINEALISLEEDDEDEDEEKEEEKEKKYFI